MDDSRYAMTLDEVSGEIIAIQQRGVPCGLTQSRIEEGYLLQDGTTLLESEKDENGFYIGGAGMDGMYLRTPQRYEPVRNDSGKITAFRLMSSYLARFNSQELEAMQRRTSRGQYALTIQRLGRGHRQVHSPYARARRTAGDRKSVV